MVLELKNVITATEREYLFLQVLRLGFLKHSSCQAARSPTGQVEFKGTNIMVFRVNLFIINRKENTWVDSQI